MSDPFEKALVTHRAELLRHCYRMMGSFADAEEVLQEALLNAWRGRAGWRGDAPLRHWLFRISTNACLNALENRRRRSLPDQLAPAAPAGRAVGEPLDPDWWVTPAPDAALFGGTAADGQLERRETVALAFVTLLQGLPPRQRAALLLKDVVGLSTEEIAEALALSDGAVASALHRARAAAPLPAASEDPSPERLRAYVRCWESRDLEGLLALLRDDVTLTMPPWAVWFRGKEAVRRFFESARFAAFWSSGVRLSPTRANGQLALAFYRDGGRTLHSLQLPRFQDDRVVAMCSLIGPRYLHGFELPDTATERFSEPPLS